MQADTLAIYETEELPDAKALLRLLSYAVIEANQLGLKDCAALIHQAAGEIQHQMDLDVEPVPAAELRKLH